VDELQLGEVVVAVHGVFGRGFHLDSGKHVLQRFVLLVRQVLVQVASSCLVAAGEGQEQLRGVLIVLIYDPFASFSRNDSLLVEAQRCSWIKVHGLHHM